jgi:hypothetical protein
LTAYFTARRKQLTAADLRNALLGSVSRQALDT